MFIMTKMAWLTGVLCCLIAVNRASAQGAGAPARASQSPQSQQGTTLRSIDPQLAGTIGFNNPSYAERVTSSPTIDSDSGTRVERFTAPNDKRVTVAIAAPKVNGSYVVPPIQSGKDPAVYFADAISKAGAHEIVMFPKGGIYNFTAAGCQTGGAHLKLNSPTDVVIDGNGSVLNFLAPCAGVAFVRPTRVVLRNFTIDWPKLQIASLGTITSSGGTGPRRNTYDLQIDRQYVTGTMPQSYKSINSWDADHNYWSLRYPDHEVGYKPRQPLSADGEARGVQSWGARFAPGERVLIRHYTTEGDAIDIIHGQDVTLQNITIYSSPGFGVAVLWGSSGFAISNCNITRAAGRLISTAADALHIANHVGDVLVENNTLAYQGDDGLNINTTTFPVQEGGTNEVAVWSIPAYIRPGDPVALFNPEMHSEDDQWRILSVTPGSVGQANKLTLDHALPSSSKGGYLVDLNFSGARFVVRNNQFLHNRARGALLQTSYGLVEGNTFTGQTMYALYLTMFPPEGPGAQDLVIANNKISETGRNGGPAAVILSRQGLVYSAPAHNPAVNQNIIFKDNLISDVPGPAFYISSANNVILYGNTLRDTNQQPLANRWNAAGALNFPVVINNASNILLLHNSIAGKSPIFVDVATTTGVKITAD
jgi:hypothetical protein